MNDQPAVPLCPDAAPARPSLVGPVVAASDCDACPIAELRHEDTGAAQVCVCGRVYADEGFRWPAAAPPPELAPAVRELAVAVEDARKLHRFARQEHERVRSHTLRPATTPHARLLGEANGAEYAATEAEVMGLILDILGPRPKRRAERWHDVIAALMKQGAAAVEEPPVPPAVGRALAARLAALPYDTARVLRVLGRRCGPSTSWEDAVAVVVDELLPVPAVSVFRPVGRPRVDRSSAPPEVQREARAEAMLGDAVRAWAEGSGR